MAGGHGAWQVITHGPVLPKTLEKRVYNPRSTIGQFAALLRLRMA